MNTNILLQDILNMSMPSNIVIMLILFKIINIIFNTHNFDTKIKNTIKLLFYGIIYIFLLNWLCSNNMCWASWILVSYQVIYLLFTILFLFSIIDITKSFRYRISNN